MVDNVAEVGKAVRGLLGVRDRGLVGRIDQVGINIFISLIFLLGKIFRITINNISSFSFFLPGPSRRDRQSHHQNNQQVQQISNDQNIMTSHFHDDDTGFGIQQSIFNSFGNNNTRGHQNQQQDPHDPFNNGFFNSNPFDNDPFFRQANSMFGRGFPF